MSQSLASSDATLMDVHDVQQSHLQSTITENSNHMTSQEPTNDAASLKIAVNDENTSSTSSATYQHVFKRRPFSLRRRLFIAFWLSMCYLYCYVFLPGSLFVFGCLVLSVLYYLLLCYTAPTQLIMNSTVVILEFPFRKITVNWSDIRKVWYFTQPGWSMGVRFPLAKNALTDTEHGFVFLNTVPTNIIMFTPEEPKALVGAILASPEAHRFRFMDSQDNSSNTTTNAQLNPSQQNNDSSQQTPLLHLRSDHSNTIQNA